MEIKKLIPVILVLSALILAVMGMYSPWWSIRMGREAEAVLNATAVTDLGFWSTVSAYCRIENETQLTVLSVQNLIVKEENIWAWNYVSNIMLGLAIGGIILTIISTALVILPAFGKPLFRFTSVIIFLAAILVFVTPLYMATTLQPLVSTFSSVMPISIPDTWVPIQPQDISGFWGSKAIPKSSVYPVWVQGGDFWIWGPASGWYLTFISGLLIFIAIFLLKEIFPSK
ncbi:MAG: hypothetical protein QXQ94_10610 [Candidatus Bathyarchaeia archaeon]